jgi:opacity protein-like surface antigen
MKSANIATVVILVAALLVIAAAQTRTQNQQGQSGRYQLLSAKYNWPGVDAENKVVFDDHDHLFRIDSATGETSILLLVAAPDKNGRFQSFWSPIGKYAVPDNARQNGNPGR